MADKKENPEDRFTGDESCFGRSASEKAEIAKARSRKAKAEPKPKAEERS